MQKSDECEYETCIQQQKEKHVPNPKIWNKIRKYVADIKIRKYKTPLLPPLSIEEIRNIERLLPSNYGIPKDLFLYLSRVSREIMVTEDYDICDIADVVTKLVKIEQLSASKEASPPGYLGPILVIDPENTLNKLNLKGICIGNINCPIEGYGSVIICLKRGRYYGTVWVEFENITLFDSLCLEQFVTEEFDM